MTIRLLSLVLVLLAAPAPAAAALHYRAEVGTGGERIGVSVCSDHALHGGTLIGGERRGGAFVDRLEGDGESAPRRRGERIAFGPLAAGQCLRYDVDARAAGQADRYRLGWRAGAYLMLSLRHWLWRPARIPDGSTLEVRLPPGWTASLPFPPLDGDGRRYRLPDTPPGWDGTAAFGRFQERLLELPGGRLRVAVLPLADADQAEALHRWVAAHARALLTAGGRLPLPDAQVLVVPLPGVSGAAPWGQVSRGGGSALKLFAGLAISETARMEDWTLAHELSHLFHPYLGDRGRWLAEGLASYYQNVLRARAGLLTPERAWSKLDAGFDRGRRERATRGRRLSDVSASYRGTMRVYWSGAAFWLEADAALRERHGRSLDEVLAAFAQRHLPAYSRWEPDRFAAELDALAGTDLFVPMYRRYARATGFPDLDELYRRLGLGPHDGRLTPRDDAPAAAVRTAIMASPPRYAEAAARGGGGR